MNDQKHYYADVADSPGHTPVYAEGPGDRKREIDPRNDLRNHSPDGFSWGYRGSGPAQLALAILADYYNDDRLAMRNYKKFMKQFVAEYSGEAPFYVTADEIEYVTGREG